MMRILKQDEIITLGDTFTILEHEKKIPPMLIIDGSPLLNTAVCLHPTLVFYRADDETNETMYDKFPQEIKNTIELHKENPLLLKQYFLNMFPGYTFKTEDIYTEIKTVESKNVPRKQEYKQNNTVSRRRRNVNIQSDYTIEVPFELEEDCAANFRRCSSGVVTVPIPEDVLRSGDEDEIEEIIQEYLANEAYNNIDDSEDQDYEVTDSDIASGPDISNPTVTRRDILRLIEEYIDDHPEAEENEEEEEEE